MIRSLTLSLLALCLVACSSDAEEEDEFADAVAVLADETVIQPDPKFEGVPVELPPARLNEVWPQIGGAPDHAPTHVYAGQELRRIWQAGITTGAAKGAPITAPPVTDGQRLYAVDAAGVVTALRTADGTRAWATELAPEITGGGRRFFNPLGRTKPRDIGFGGGAAVSNGRVFVASGFGFLAALDAASGELLWKTETGAPMRNPPSLAEGTLYAVSISNELFALDAETGEERWTYQSFEESARFLASAAPAIDGPSVIVPFSSGEVVSLATSNGRVQWQAVIARTSRLNALSTLGDIAGSPVIDRGAVFVVSQSGQMVGIDARTGAVAWEQPVGGAHTPWAAGETVFVLSNQGTVAAVNRADGVVRWNHVLPLYRNEKKRKNRIIWAGPVLAGGLLYLTSTGGEMVALSPQDGEVAATYKLKGPATQSPIVAGGRVYVLLENGQVEAFEGERPLPEAVTEALSMQAPQPREAEE